MSNSDVKFISAEAHNRIVDSLESQLKEKNKKIELLNVENILLRDSLNKALVRITQMEADDARR